MKSYYEMANEVTCLYKKSMEEIKELSKRIHKLTCDNADKFCEDIESIVKCWSFQEFEEFMSKAKNDDNINSAIIDVVVTKFLKAKLGI